MSRKGHSSNHRNGRNGRNDRRSGRYDDHNQNHESRRQNCPSKAPDKTNGFRTSEFGPPKSLMIRPMLEGKTDNHKAYIKAMQTSDVTFCEGIAGTGKTYMAVGHAIHLMLDGDKKRANRITKLVITRPIVPAGGEDMGFLPGDLKAKADPYMVPIYESIRKFCRNDEEYKQLTDHEVDNPMVEIVPLAFMRGRTFDDCFVILDEAQNTTKEQMIMFLTRMGKNCKVVVTGDLTQSDIDEEFESGLEAAITRLDGYGFTRGKVSCCFLDAEDMMRNDLISEIIIAFQEGEGDGEEDEEDGPDNDPGPDPKPSPKPEPEPRKTSRPKCLPKNRITPYFTEKRESINGQFDIES